MTLEELSQKAITLPMNERLELIGIITESLQQDSPNERWQFLEPRAESWRKQLYIKGRKLPASVVWSTMLADNMTPEESADDWDLPIGAVHEAIRYCESHRKLIDQEAEAELASSERRGVALEPTLVNR